jgi:hypothetical protein
MNHLIKNIGSAALAVAALTFSTTSAKAGHVYAGVLDTNGTPGIQAGEALSFINRTTDAVVTGASQGVQVLAGQSVGNQAGLYMSNAITFTALANGGNGTVWDGTAAVVNNAYAALTGSYINLVMNNITGPTGAKFSFWDQGATTATSTYTIGTGWSGVDNFLLTNDGITYFPTQTDTVGPTLGTSVVNGTGTIGNITSVLDPFGHIHGRSFTVDTPGDYTVSYVLHDLKGIQADSSPFVVAYSTPEPSRALLIAAAGSLIAFRRRLN